VISGGVNARAMRRHFLSNGFDIVALGDGEQTIVDIVREYGRPNPDFSRVAGISYMKDGRVVDQVAGTLPSLDHLPFPAWDAFPLEVYRDLGAPQARVRLNTGIMFAGLQTSRGCQDKCTFCHISEEKLNTDLVGRIGFLRSFSPARIGEEVDRAYALGVRRLYFEDDNLFYNKKRLMELVPYLKRDGLEYSNVNGANLRFLFRKESDGRHVVDTVFIAMLADFGLRELTLPFETHSPEMMKKYASGKFNALEMNPFDVVRALKDVGIELAGNFMIGFRDEPWESVLRTRDYARLVREAGVDGVAFMIPVPYPGTVDFNAVMQDPQARADFDKDPLKYTDNMHWRGKPLFPTVVDGARLATAVREFWYEVNDQNFTGLKNAANVMRQDVPPPQQGAI
jgi:anaerobic magnesium-protoporphyrin IX monomethyl ester cyclase